MPPGKKRRCPAATPRRPRSRALRSFGPSSAPPPPPGSPAPRARRTRRRGRTSPSGVATSPPQRSIPHPVLDPRARRRAAPQARSRVAARSPRVAGVRRTNKRSRRSAGPECPSRHRGSVRCRYRPTGGARDRQGWRAAPRAKPVQPHATRPRKRPGRYRRRTARRDPRHPAPDRAVSRCPRSHAFRERRRASGLSRSAPPR
ncbi:hypothetical protein ABIC16_001944 [Sphingomonas sp. PvP055]